MFDFNTQNSGRNVATFKMILQVGRVLFILTILGALCLNFVILTLHLLLMNLVFVI